MMNFLFIIFRSMKGVISSGR